MMGADSHPPTHPLLAFSYFGLKQAGAEIRARDRFPPERGLKVPSSY